MLRIAIIGRPNVGKSTLFNRLLKKQVMVTDNRPGITRDQIEELWEVDDKKCLLIDTGGWDDSAKDVIGQKITDRVDAVLQSVDLVLFVVDGSIELTALDTMLAERIRKKAKNVILIANKTDKHSFDDTMADLHRIGISPIITLSAAHGRGIGELEDYILEFLATVPGQELQIQAHIAVMGRPNVGKSTLVNALLGDERVLVHDLPGTTRDPIDTYFSWNGKSFCLIDTAGIRRQAKREDRIEHASVKKSLAKLDLADIALLVVDARLGVSDGDQRIGNVLLEAHKPALVIANKWDLVDPSLQNVGKFKLSVMEQLHFLPWIRVECVSALTKDRISGIMPALWEILSEKPRSLNPEELYGFLKEALRQQPPPRYRTRAVHVGQIKVGCEVPLTLIISCSEPEGLSEGYRRYLWKQLNIQLGLTHKPLRLVFRARRRPKSHR